MRLRRITVLALKLLVDMDERTQTQIAADCGIERTLFNKFVNGEREPDEEAVRRMAAGLGVHPSKLTDEISRQELIDWIQQRPKLSEPRPAVAYGVKPALLDVLRLTDFPADSMDVVELPVYVEIRPAAGNPSHIDEAATETVEWIAIPVQALRPQGKWFGVLVKGDSMSAVIQDGDTVVCRVEEDPQSGSIVVATVADLGTVIKRFEKRVGKPALLTSEPAPDVGPYADIECVPDQTFIHGVAVYRMEGLTRRRRRHPKSK